MEAPQFVSDGFVVWRDSAVVAIKIEEGGDGAQGHLLLSGGHVIVVSARKAREVMDRLSRHRAAEGWDRK